MVLLVADAWSGRSKLSKKQGMLVGLGRALSSVTASSIVCGDPFVPAGGRQTAALAFPAAPAALLDEPPLPSAPPTFPNSDCGAALQAKTSNTDGSRPNRCERGGWRMFFVGFARRRRLCAKLASGRTCSHRMRTTCRRVAHTTRDGRTQDRQVSEWRAEKVGSAFLRERKTLGDPSAVGVEYSPRALNSISRLPPKRGPPSLNPACSARRHSAKAQPAPLSPVCAPRSASRTGRRPPP